MIKRLRDFSRFEVPARPRTPRGGLFFAAYPTHLYKRHLKRAQHEAVDRYFGEFANDMAVTEPDMGVIPIDSSDESEDDHGFGMLLCWLFMQQPRG